MNPAPPTIARWVLHYRTLADDKAAIQRREVRIHTVHPRRMQLVGFCELRQAERTFSFLGIAKVEDAATGEEIDFDAWLTAYISMRRTRAASERPKPTATDALLTVLRAIKRIDSGRVAAWGPIERALRVLSMSRSINALDCQAFTPLDELRLALEVLCERRAPGHTERSTWRDRAAKACRALC